MPINYWISLLSFIVCLGVAKALTKTKTFAFLGERDSRFETIDGLRGFLALSVFFHHFVITYHWKIDGKWVRPPEDFYQNYGKVGVGMFFMITGFLFVSKILKSNGNINWLKLYESRFFRIFPLYIFTILCVSFVAFSHFDFHINSSAIDLVKQYAHWFLFIGGQINEFDDSKLVIASVDWTLKYEWLFYFSLPIISVAIFRGRLLGVSIIIATSIFLFFNPVHFSIFTTEYFILFAAGGITSWVVIRANNKVTLSRNRLVSSLVVLLILASLFYPKTFDVVHVAIIYSIFVLVAKGCDIFGILRSNPAKLLGEISYSVYLLHGFVLYMAFTYSRAIDIAALDSVSYSLLMPIIGVIVIIFSSATYLLIEKPSMEIGKKYKITKSINTLASNANKALQRTSR